SARRNPRHRRLAARGIARRCALRALRSARHRLARPRARRRQLCRLRRARRPRRPGARLRRLTDLTAGPPLPHLRRETAGGAPPAGPRFRRMMRGLAPRWSRPLSLALPLASLAAVAVRADTAKPPPAKPDKPGAYAGLGAESLSAADIARYAPAPLEDRVSR